METRVSLQCDIHRAAASAASAVVWHRRRHDASLAAQKLSAPAPVMATSTVNVDTPTATTPSASDFCATQWSQWSSCSDLCDGGNETRVFGAEETDLSEADIALTCAVEVGAIESRVCASHPVCGPLIGGIVAFVVLVGACALLVLYAMRRAAQEKRVTTTNMGKRFLRVVDNDVSAAIRLWRRVEGVQKQYPDFSFQTIWFAFDWGRRSTPHIRAMLDRAARHRRADPRISLVEAMERAEWLQRRPRIDGLHRMLVKHVEDTRAIADEIQRVQKLWANTSEQDRPASLQCPFLHVAVCTRWQNPEHQLWVVERLLARLPKAYLQYRYLPAPCDRRVDSPMNVLQFAIKRRCPPKILRAITKADKTMAEDCGPAYMSLLVS